MQDCQTVGQAACCALVDTQTCPLHSPCTWPHPLTQQVSLDYASNVYSPTWDPVTAEMQFSQALTLAVQNQAPFGSPVSVLEARLNCNGLPYCSPGGTGVWVSSPGPSSSGVPFPDGTGYSAAAGGGLMPQGGPTGDFQLRPHATFSQINAGDTFIATARLSNGSTLVLPGCAWLLRVRRTAAAVEAALPLAGPLSGS